MVYVQGGHLSIYIIHPTINTIRNSEAE